MNRMRPLPEALERLEHRRLPPFGTAAVQHAMHPPLPIECMDMSTMDIEMVKVIQCNLRSTLAPSSELLNVIVAVSATTGACKCYAMPLGQHGSWQVMVAGGDHIDHTAPNSSDHIKQHAKQQHGGQRMSRRPRWVGGESGKGGQAVGCSSQLQTGWGGGVFHTYTC